MKIRLFTQRKNKRFNYIPRYYQGKTTSNIYNFDSKFTKYRETTNDTDYGAHWKAAREASRTRKNKSVSKMLLLIIAILVLIFLYIIDFDVSIFMQKM